MRLKKVEQVKEVVSEGGVILEIRKKKEMQTEQEATVDAYIVAIGKTANMYLDSHEGTGKPEYKVGDLVTIGKYAGRLMPDVFDDDEIYRLIKDIDIHAKFVGKRTPMPEAEALEQALREE